jgi:3-deoxy-D-manno-octulosonic-acid transferase
MLYTLLFYLAIPFVLFRLWHKGKKNRAYRVRIGERFGYTSFKSQRSIWLHAVSLGETVAAIPLIEELLKTFPDYDVVLTSTTPTGSEKIRQHFGSRVLHCYFPYDLPVAWRRFFKGINPAFILIMETELWPNLLAYADHQSVPVMLVNARLSDISIKEYAYLRPFVKQMLVKIKVIAAQSALDAERFISLGANPAQVIDVGNLKFDMKVAEHLVAKANELRPNIVRTPIWIAASTHKGEDELILGIHKELLQTYPDALLIIVPRHPERFDEVTALAQAAGFKTIRKSDAIPDSSTQVFVGDTMGELQFYYALADVAFVGGTLMPIGGHNPLEPLALGKKVIVGPYTNNAKMMYDELAKAHLVDVRPDVNGVKQALFEALQKPLDQDYINTYMQKFQGVKGRVMALIQSDQFQK